MKCYVQNGVFQVKKERENKRRQKRESSRTSDGKRMKMERKKHRRRETRKRAQETEIKMSKMKAKQGNNGGTKYVTTERKTIKQRGDRDTI